MLAKIYAVDEVERRMQRVSGRPDPAEVSTSLIERQNLTMRMSMRRFTRMTNAFSKRIENHAASVALHYFHYNFCRIHTSVRVTPAMEAGVTDRLHDLGELVALIRAAYPEPNRPKTYQKRLDLGRIP